MSSPDWARSYAFEELSPTRGYLRSLLTQADRLLTDAQVTAISVPSRYTAAHGAVVQLARLALAAYGYRTMESHHYWAIESLRYTVTLQDELVDLLHTHRGRRHDAAYGANPGVTETELADLISIGVELRAQVLAWIEADHGDLWGSRAP